MLSLPNLLYKSLGLTQDKILEINDYTRHSFKDTNKLIATLNEIRNSQELLVILPDFDMDGVSAACVGLAGFKQLGFNVEVFVPNYADGHNITEAIIDRLVAQHPGVKHIITCDAGINSNEAMVYAKEFGIQTLVTDHHVELEPGSTADIAVNPCRMDETHPHPHMCGAAVLQQVLAEYAEKYSPENLEHINLLELFAGLGTVADVMPVLYRNRLLISRAVAITNALAAGSLNRFLHRDTTCQDYYEVFYGYSQILEALKANKKLYLPVNEETFGFYIAPMFNAIRRIEADHTVGFKVFFSSNHETQKDAANQLFEINIKRRELLGQYIDELLTKPQPYAPYVYLTNAPKGMLGLIAAEMLQHNQHVCAVLNGLSGSGRSDGVEIISTLDGYDKLNAIGHQQACGVSVDSENDLPLLYDVFKQASEEFEALILLNPEAFRPEGLSLDTRTSIPEIQSLVDTIEGLRPFGQDFEYPTITTKSFITHLNRMGSDKQHLKIQLVTGFDMLFWNISDKDEIALTKARLNGKRIQFTFKPQTGSFRGRDQASGVITSYAVLD